MNITIRLVLATCFLSLATTLVYSQVGIGTATPSSKLEVVGAGTTSATTSLKVGNASSTIFSVRNDGLVEVSSTSQGFLPPRMTTAQRDAIANPQIGSVIFNTTASRLQVYKEVINSVNTQFGNTTISSGATCLVSSGNMWFRPTVTGTITQIELYAHGAGEVASIAIKSNSSCNSPTLLGTSNTITMASGWNTWAFATPVSVVANTTYFITSDNANNCLGVRWANSGDDVTTGTVNDPMPGCSLSGSDPASRITVSHTTTTGAWADLGDGSVTSVGLTTPTGLSVSGSPITSTGTLALTMTSGYSIPTTSSQTNWDAAYNDKINGATISGTTSKMLTLTKQGGGTITTTFTDDNSDAVSSVFGRTGAIMATTGDYTTAKVTESGNLYFTDERARSSISVTNIGTGGAATYSATTGVINIPQYQEAITNPVTGTGAAGRVAYWAGTSSQTSSSNLVWDNSNTRLGVGTASPHVSSIVEMNSTTQGFLPPRMTRAQRDLISTPAAGLVVWCANCGPSGELQVYNGSVWTNMVGGAASPSLPTVTTTATSSITLSGAAGGGNVTDDGGAANTTRGVVWSTSPNPTVALSTKTADGTGAGTYTSTIGGLSSSTVYYIRAYATNAAGTSYGSELSFSTLGVGSNYGGGKIAYIFQSGDPGFVSGETHGIIVSIDQWNAAWGCLNFTNALGTIIGTGAQNTSNIVAGCADAGTAAKTCADYTYTMGGIIYDDWHLPSITELDKVFINGSSVGGFNGQGMYWSSSQSSTNPDRALQIIEWVPGASFHTYKANAGRVRAVRIF